MNQNISIVITNRNDFDLAVQFFDVHGIVPYNGYDSSWDYICQVIGTGRDTGCSVYLKSISVEEGHDLRYFSATLNGYGYDAYKVPADTQPFTEEQKTMILLGWIPFERFNE